MTEVKAPVRVLQSGKVYRQMFDAEVQLMKSLDASKLKNSRASLPRVSLPEIGNRAGSAERENTSAVGVPSLVSQNAGTMLTERQKSWVEGMPNDATTENPVVYRQLSTVAARRLKSLKVDEEVQAVHGLPNVVPVRKRNSNIIEKISEKRNERHQQALENMHNDLCLVSNRAEPRINLIGANLQSQLKEDDINIAASFKSIVSNDDLVDFSYDRLEILWNDVESHSAKRRAWIDRAHELFNEVEDERLETITEIFKVYSVKFEEIAYLLSPDIHRLVEKEAMMINQSILANRRSYAKLHINLLEGDIEREVDQHRTWLERVKDWRKLNAEMAVQQFTEFMKSDLVTNPPDVIEIMEKYQTAQEQLSKKRQEILDQLHQLKPPTSTKQSVHKWNTSLCKCQEDLDDLHTKWVRALHHKYEDTCQMCLSEIEKYKENLLLSKVCDEDDMKRIVNDHLLPQVGDQLKIFEKHLEEMDKHLEEQATHAEKMLKTLFKYALGAAHLWDNHQLGMTKQDRLLQDDLEETREAHDIDNQEREMKLDVTLDRLRQESTEEALNVYLEQCLVMLANIKQGYMKFHSLQLEKVSKYPEMVGSEVSRYDANVCQYFNLMRVPTKPEKTSSDDKEAAPESQVQDETGQARSPASFPRLNEPTSPVLYDAQVLQRISLPIDLEGATNQRSSVEVDDQSKMGEEEEQSIQVFNEILTTDKGTEFYILPSPASSTDLKDEELNAEKIDVEEAEEQSPQEEVIIDSKDSNLISSKPEYVKNVYIDTDFIKELKNRIRMAFLNHLDEWTDETAINSETQAKDKSEELAAELDLRLHLHAPRSKRIEIDVRNVRAAELVLHRERVSRHCKGITAALESLKTDFVRMTKQHDEEAIAFRNNVEKIDSSFINTSKSSKLKSLNDTLQCDLSNYVDDVKTSLRDFRRTLDTTLGKLRESNAQCARSFKLFCEGGNFSPDETVPLRKRLEKMSQRVDNAEGAVMKDLEGMESRRIEQGTELVNKVEEKYRNHLADLIFLESMNRWATNAQVLIKKEAAISNGMAAEVNAHLSTLRRRVDACEKPNFDKEDVSTELLNNYALEIIGALQTRAEYLNCKITGGRAVSLGDEQSREAIAPPEPPKTAERPTGSVPQKSGAQLSSRQSVEPHGTASLRNRQPSDDAAIGLIKTILRAPKEKTILDVDDVRSTATGTTRAPPSTANSLSAVSSRLGKVGGSKQGQASSTTATPESPNSRRPPTNDGVTVVYKRRDTKFDIKYMVFGTKPAEGEFMKAKIQQLLYNALDGMLSTADIYFKQKGMRPVTRTQLIQDSFDACAEKVVEKLLKFEMQADDFHNNSLQDFRRLLHEMEYELCHVPRLVLNDLLKTQLRSLKEEQRKAELLFKEKEREWENQKKANKTELRPTLGHPDQAKALKYLSELERNRQEQHTAGIEDHKRAMRDCVHKRAATFAEQLSSASNRLMKEFDGLLTEDDVIVGRVLPHKERTSVLVRRRAEGYDMAEVADPSFGVKPIIERGNGKWPAFAVEKLGVNTRNLPSTISDALETNQITLPQARTTSYRNSVFDQYLNAHEAANQSIDTCTAARLDGEERWRANWEESISHVKGLYI